MRTLPAALVTSLANGSIHKRSMVRFNTSPSIAAFWNGNWELAYGGDTYQGIGEAIQFGDITQGQDQSARQMDIVFSPLAGLTADDLVSVTYYRKEALIYNIYFNAKTMAQEAIELRFSGIIGPAGYQQGRDKLATINVPILSYNWSLDAKGTRLRTDADQQAIVAGDLFFEYTKTVVNQPVWWGKAGPQRPSQIGVTGPTNTTSTTARRGT